MPTLTVWHYDTPMGAEAGEVRLKALQEHGALTVHDAVTVAWMPGAHQPHVGHFRHATSGAAGKGSVLGALGGHAGPRARRPVPRPAPAWRPSPNGCGAPASTRTSSKT